jgi:hypothetical protein
MNSTAKYRLYSGLVPFALAICCSVVASAAKPPRRLDVVPSGKTITVQRGTAGAEIVLVGYELATLHYSPLYRRVVRRQTADGRGAVAFELGREVEAASVWVAVDVASGAYGSSGSRALKLREAELPPQALRRGSSGNVNRVETRFDSVYSLVVRPGVGIWEMAAGDGAAGDSDGVLNGKLGFAPTSMKAIGKSRVAVGELQHGDVIVIFVPRQMGYLITEVKK